MSYYSSPHSKKTRKGLWKNLEEEGLELGLGLELEGADSNWAQKNDFYFWQLLVLELEEYG